MTWRIISAIQTIRRYKKKIFIIATGPILDTTYFDNAPSHITKNENSRAVGSSQAASSSAAPSQVRPPSAQK